MKCLVFIVNLLTISVFIQLLAATKVLPSNGGLHISISDNETELDLEVDPWAFFKNYELGEFAEGDLRISSEVGNRRTFLKKAKFWKEGIVPFFVNEIIKNDNHALTVLLNAMRTISIATSNCVQFIPIDINQIRTYPQLPFLNITGDEQGCFADIGQSNYENIQSQINLNINQCFLLPGNSLHELLHILGQTHEHMRPDRDQYIRIVWDNVAPGSQSNFEILDFSEVENFNLPYDYESVTHYSRTAFTVDPALATIVPLNKTSTIGQRTHLSEIDKKKLNIQYSCPKNRKRFKFVDILELYNITADNATINHTHEVNILSNLPEQNKSHTISPQQLGQSNTHLGVSTYTNKSPHTMIFKPTPTSQLSYATPTNYEPFFGNLIEKLSKKPYTSITINGIPYNPNFDLNPYRQTMIPSNNKYIYPTYPSSYNPYRNEFSTENNPSSNLMKYFNSIFNQQPFGNIPYSSYGNVSISSYQISRYNPTPNFNHISSTYEPITTSYEPLFYKSPTVSYIQPKPNRYNPIPSIQTYLNSYKPTYSIQPEPNPYYPSYFNYNPQKMNPYELLYLNPSANYLPYKDAPSDKPTKNNDKSSNYETVLTKLTTLKPVPTTPETIVRTKVQFNQHSACNITSKSRRVYPSRGSLKPNTLLNPITNLLRLINPLLNNAKNIMTFELRPPILNHIPYVYNQEIENDTPPNKEKTDKNSPLDETVVPKDLSNEKMTPLNAIFPHLSYYPNEYPSTYENRRNDIIVEPSEHNGHNWNRVPNRQINHPLVNGINYPIRFINNEYPSLQSDDASFETNENTYPIRFTNNEYPSLNGNPYEDIPLESTLPYLNRIPIIRNKYSSSEMNGNRYPITFTKHEYPSTNENHEDDIAINPFELLHQNLNRVPINKNIYSPRNGNSYPVRFINYENPKSGDSMDGILINPSGLRYNLNRAPINKENYSALHGNVDFIKYIKNKYPSTKQTPENDNPLPEVDTPQLIKNKHGKNNPIKYTNIKYHPSNETPENSLEPKFPEIDTIQLIKNNHGQNNPIKYIKTKSPTSKTPENNNKKKPLGPKLPDIIKMIRNKNINMKDTETENGSKILLWKIKSPRSERIPMIIKWNGNGNIHRISYIKNRLPPPKQNPEGGNHLKLNSPNWGRIPNESKYSPLNNYFNQFPRNGYPEELAATDPSNIPSYLKALISHVYPETGKNTQYIGNLPYDSLALKSPDLSNEHPSEPSTDKDIDDIIKMYQIIKNVYPSPNRDIDEITKVYKILHSGYSSQNRNDKDNGQNPDQTGLLQRINYKFIPSNNLKTSNKTSSGPIRYNSQSSTGGVIMNPNEYTRPKLNKVPLELNPHNEFPATEYFIKYFKMNPQESKSPGLKFTNTHCHPNVEAMRPSINTNDLKTNPESSIPSSLTPEKLREIIKILGPSINNNGIPTNIPENYERFLEILNPSILKELLSSNQTNVESNDKNPPPSTENDRNISNNPSKSKAAPVTITPDYMSVFKTVYPSNNMRKYPANEISFNNGNNFAEPSIELIRNKSISESENPLKMNNDFIESPIKYQNPEDLNPLSDRNNQKNPSIPHYFIIPSDHNPILHRPYSTLKFIFNPQKINDDMNPNQEIHSNNDDKNPNQEQSQRVSPLLKNVQRPLPRSNWLEYFITLCNKNKKERNDLYVPNSPKYEQTL